MENLNDLNLAEKYIDPMPIEDFIFWLEMPCSAEDLNCCYNYYIGLPESELTNQKLDLILLK